MGKLLKVVVGFVLLLLAVVVIAPMVIDPNDYREEIQTVVKEKTGRELFIKGQLSLSVFPWIGVGIEQVRLSNASGFKGEYFAQIEQAEVKVKLLPLLSQHLEVSTVVLKGLQLNLAKNKAGVSNWADMVGTPESQTEAESTEKTSDSSASAIGAIAVGGLQIIDARITWDDASKKERYQLMDLDLTTDALSLGQPMGLDLAFTVDSSKPKATMRLKLQGDVLINAALDKVDVQQLRLVVDAAGEPVPNGAMQVELTSNLAADLANAGQLIVNPLTIKFDDSTLTGQAQLSDFSKPAIQFDLAVDAINVDRYMPKQAETDASAGKASGAVPTSAATALIPVDTIRSLDIDGVFKVGSLIVNGLKAEQTSVQVQAKNGVLKTKQGVKAFYNGSYQGETVVDARQNTPKVSINERISGVNIEPLLMDLMGESKLSGVANINADLTTRGVSIDDFKSALNGRTDFSFKDGAISGIDVAALMQQAKAVLSGDVAAATIDSSGNTPFSDMSGSATINNGLVKNNDLLITTPLMQVKGVGQANLVNEQLDYSLSLQRTKALSEAEQADKKDLKNLIIPVNVNGTFANPSIKLDVQAILLATQQEKIDQKKQQLKEKLEKKISDKLGDKLKGQAGELLKGLF